MHLDQRAMQLIQICNSILNYKGSEDYQCSDYFVMPLGPRSGLIQWVEGGTPLFQIYRKWRSKQVNVFF